MSVCLGWNASEKRERKDAFTGQTAAKTSLHHMRETGTERTILFKKSFFDAIRWLEKRDLPSSNCAKMFVTGEGLGLRV